MKIRKKYDTTISKKFGDGSLASISFGTSREEEINPDISDEAIQAAHTDLFEQVRKSTRGDIKRASKQDPFVRNILENIEREIKLEQKVEKAKKKLKHA